MQFRLKAVAGRTVAIASLTLAFVLIAGTAFASLTFSTSAISSDGALTLNPTGQPVTVNGDLDTAAKLTVGGNPGTDSTIIGFENGLTQQVISNEGSDGQASLMLYGSAIAPNFHNGGFIGLASSRGSRVSPSAIQAGDYIGEIDWLGHDGNAIQYGATLYGLASENWTPTAQGVDLYFLANKNGETGDSANWLYFGAATGPELGRDDMTTTLRGNTDGNSVLTTGPLAIDMTAYSSWQPANTRVALYIPDYAGKATNPYYSWYDSRGVGRCKEDGTFNSVGQSICVVYNPQFTKYTAGATNYERIVYGQWDSNVAEIGPEAGGTGTLRKLRLLGSEIDTNGNLVVSGSVDATGYKAGGVAGLNRVVNLKGNDGNNCTETISQGIITASTCP